MKPVRRWRVRVEASGYAIVSGVTKKEAIANARTGLFVRSPRPLWRPLVSDIKEIDEEA